MYSNPRQEAGGPLAANILKCQLKPMDAKDYKVAFAPAELARLKAIFPAACATGRSRASIRCRSSRGRRSVRRRRTWCSRSAARSPARGNHDQGTQNPLSTQIL